MIFRKQAKLVCVVFCVAGFVAGKWSGARAFSGGPDPARTGAPNELTCATGECHGSARTVDLQRFSILAPETYQPGRTYQIIVRHVSNDLNRQRWGFQITALTAANARAGSWQSLGNETQIVQDNFLNRQYAQHTLAGSFNGQSGGASWTVNWTAPATDAGLITFYAAGNQADGNNSSSGDQIFTAQAISDAALPAPTAASVPGSLLVFNLFTSQSTNRGRQDSRINLTNTHESQTATIRLLFVNGSNGEFTSFFVRLAALQTTSLLASDLDPGVAGYLLAIACDEATGCPLSFNHLLGDEYIKLASGHAANLAAESFSLSPTASPMCVSEMTSATLRFDGFDYGVVPRALTLSNLASRANGNDTVLIVNRFGGDWRTGAPPLRTLSGMLYDDAEQGFDLSLAPDGSQFFASLSDQTLRTTPRFSEIIKAFRNGWMRFWAADETALLGAAINFHPQVRVNTNAFNYGHNLHHLSFAPLAILTLPVTQPSF